MKVASGSCVARYYDPRTSVWQSVDPILEKYLPRLSDLQKAKEKGIPYLPESNLPGMGGVYNSKNIGMYSYAHNGPIIYKDPDGKQSVWAEMDAASNVMMATGAGGVAVFVEPVSTVGGAVVFVVGVGGKILAKVGPKVSKFFRVRKMQNAVQAGRVFETASLVKLGLSNLKKISVPGITQGKTHIPDIFTGKMIGEIKLVKKLSLSPQLQSFVKFAKDKKIPFNLFVKKGHTESISKPLKEAIKSTGGKITYLD